MNADQKFKLAKTIIVATALIVTSIAIVWLVVTHKPSSMKTAIDFDSRKIEVDCTFYQEDMTQENSTPRK